MTSTRYLRTIGEGICGFGLIPEFLGPSKISVKTRPVTDENKIVKKEVSGEWKCDGGRLVIVG